MHFQKIVSVYSKVVSALTKNGGAMDIVKTYTETSAYLSRIFKLLNERYFGGSLEEPVITIQSTPNVYGHFTPGDSWNVMDAGKKEINIGAGTLDRPIENVASTMLHEMVHYYCTVNSIKDTSRNGTYHNKNFKEQAEKRGLVIKKDSRYGWTVTEPSEELKAFIKENGLTDIGMSRKEKQDTGSGTAAGGAGKRKSSTRKYQCTSCGISVRATKEVRIACMDCGVQMELIHK